MGRRVTVEVVDDLDGSTAEGVATIGFGLDGVEYEIDLGPANAARLREVLRRYAVCARRVLRDAEPAVRGALPSPVRSLDVEELRAVRAWARGRGFSVSDRGRLSEAVLSAYEDAHPNARKPVSPPGHKLWNWPVT
ncbi:Lsr2 family protein [Umezawaea sp. Da 62-37]|uniref:histone-like nucleoid-structuring protein Lsr2 n=1 Tax=Umezawaea sp. Da 62-37 TaxID=3075927 RepID=UPI0028F6EB9C|nr:Lsr2 family protein [Umezawaea sp. Da 62-37]WNV88589.1 Lsr2 family protein [Umezawaea sp. Da 62-37]